MEEELDALASFAGSSHVVHLYVQFMTQLCERLVSFLNWLVPPR